MDDWKVLPARMCFEIDQRMGEPAGCRWFLNWWDETPRAKLFAQLLPEVELAIEQRKRCDSSI